ncbi:MAG: carrier protein [Labilithrix sp.]|nr:carrier protein [Labilithrix sp.]
MAKDQAAPATSVKEGGALTKFLSLFAVVHPNEVFSVLMLTLDGVLLLASYYFLKVIREPLILDAPGGAQIKSYATAFLAILLIGVFYGYRALAQRVDRLKLITYTKLFCAGCLVLFSFAGHAGMKIGIPFFLWVGCYSLTIIAQLWAFANDIFTPEQGKRVFAIIGVGSSLGALLGSKLAGLAVKPLGYNNMMLVPAGVLIVCLVIVRLVNAHETVDAARKKEAEVPPGGKGGIATIFSNRYILLIAAIILMVNLVNTNGEYVLDRVLTETAHGKHLDAKAAKEYIGEFKANYFFWANLGGVVLQLFVASRVFKLLDVRGALFLYPVLTLATYTGMTMFPVLAVVLGSKIAENSLDYSIYNQAKQSLWLPTSREQKYVAKQAIDTFFVRGGDLVAGLLVAGMQLGIPKIFGGDIDEARWTRIFTVVNVAFAAVFLGIVLLMRKEHKKVTDEADEAAKNDPAAQAKLAEAGEKKPGDDEPRDTAKAAAV